MNGYVGNVGLCMTMWGCVWLCRAMYGYAEVCRAMYGYVGYVGLCRLCGYVFSVM